MSTLHHIPGRTKTLPRLRVGIGGPVSSRKTTLLEMLCKAMRERYDLIAITNDISTKEDQRLLTVSGALLAERILGVETGGSPHTAIREDASINLETIDRMLEQLPDADVVFVERGGDNLTATFSPELSDLTIYVIDVAAGEETSCKGGSGITKSDLAVMRVDTKRMCNTPRACNAGTDFIATGSVLDDAKRRLGGLPARTEPDADAHTKNPPPQVNGNAGS